MAGEIGAVASGGVPVSGEKTTASKGVSFDLSRNQYREAEAAAAAGSSDDAQKKQQQLAAQQQQQRQQQQQQAAQQTPLVKKQAVTTTRLSGKTQIVISASDVWIVGRVLAVKCLQTAKEALSRVEVARTIATDIEKMQKAKRAKRITELNKHWTVKFENENYHNYAVKLTNAVLDL